MTETPSRHLEKPAVIGDPEEALPDQQSDHLRVGDLRWAARLWFARRKEIIDQNVSFSQKGVKIGGHRGLRVGVVFATLLFGALLLFSYRRDPGTATRET